MIEYFYVAFGDLSCIGFLDIALKKNTHTYTQTHKCRWKPHPETVVDMGDEKQNIGD